MIRVIDFETTGFPPDADVIEAAYVDVMEGDTSQIHAFSVLVKSARPVSVEARAAHHIMDEEIAKGLEWKRVQEYLIENSPVFCAHNASFEKEFFNPPGSKWIDTYKCALRLWPDAPKHTNQVLRYYLEGCDPGQVGFPPHRALPDCHVTARILVKCLGMVPIAQLFVWSDEPPLLTKVPMGKHFGKLWSTVPTDYLEWCTKRHSMLE